MYSMMMATLKQSKHAAVMLTIRVAYLTISIYIQLNTAEVKRKKVKYTLVQALRL